MNKTGFKLKGKIAKTQLFPGWCITLDRLQVSVELYVTSETPNKINCSLQSSSRDTIPHQIITYKI